MTQQTMMVDQKNSVAGSVHICLPEKSFIQVGTQYSDKTFFF